MSLLTDGAFARGIHFGSCKADEVPLLSSQSTHLSTTGMRYSTGNEISSSREIFYSRTYYM